MSSITISGPGRLRSASSPNGASYPVTFDVSATHGVITQSGPEPWCYTYQKAQSGSGDVATLHGQYIHLAPNYLLVKEDATIKVSGQEVALSIPGHVDIPLTALEAGTVAETP